MITIKAFKALRPAEGQAEKVASLPYDVFSEAEARAEVQNNPESFLRVVRPETTMAPGTDPYDVSVYAKAKSNLDTLVDKGVLIREEKPALYLYELIRNGRSQTGLVACASVEDYVRGAIKKHELTREDKENDRVNHVNTCSANTGPVFLTYPGREEINALVDEIKKQKPVYDFMADDGITHRVWVMASDDDIHAFTEAFKGINCLYIADGHHRAASAARVAQMRAETGNSADAPWKTFLTVIFPAEQLTIMDYNRVVADTNGLSTDVFLEKISEKFEILSKSESIYHPEGKGYFGLYLDEQWYALKAKDGIYDPDDPVESLDVSILQKNLLAPVLGIEDPRKDPRIDFVGGIRGLEELERRCHEDMKVAFALYPTSVDELMAIADADLLMPPKSTWFEPKLRSGLFVHTF